MANAVLKKVDIVKKRTNTEYLNLLSMLNLVDINHLSDSSKRNIYNNINVSKSFYDGGDISTAYNLLNIEYENIKNSTVNNESTFDKLIRLSKLDTLIKYAYPKNEMEKEQQKNLKFCLISGFVFLFLIFVANSISNSHEIKFTEIESVPVQSVPSDVTVEKNADVKEQVTKDKNLLKNTEIISEVKNDQAK